MSNEGKKTYDFGAEKPNEIVNPLPPGVGGKGGEGEGRERMGGRYNLRQSHLIPFGTFGHFLSWFVPPRRCRMMILPAIAIAIAIVVIITATSDRTDLDRIERESEPELVGAVGR